MNNKKKKEVNKLKEALSYIIIILVVITIRTFFVTPIRVQGSSMKPTLKNGEIMILNKITLSFNKINRYDIVVIKSEDKKIIKRVYGLPGDFIKIEDNKIIINDKIIVDKYGKGNTSDYKEILLSDDEYFVLGDNREVSKDSRYIGPVKYESIIGKTKLVLFPFTKIGIVK